MVFVRVRIMDLFGMYNCVLLFLSFTSPSSIRFHVAYTPSALRERLFLGVFFSRTVKVIYHYANTFPLELKTRERGNREDEKDTEGNEFGLRQEILRGPFNRSNPPFGVLRIPSIKHLELM